MPSRTVQPTSHPTARSALVALAAAALLTLPGCGALLLVGGAGTSAIAFATGELRATQEASLPALDGACESVFASNGYKEIETERKDEQIRWQATTPGGEPVDVRLKAEGPEQTEVRIRIGVFGNESRSRLLLEQLGQAL